MLAIISIAFIVILILEDNTAEETGTTCSNGQKTWIEMKKYGKTYWVIKESNHSPNN